jgi:murein DD-endopeptidase MepM/ murein hydrolase activator NlpD
MLSLAVALVAFTGSAQGVTLTLDGPLEQGALLRGAAEPGTRVSFDGHPVRVAPDGHFILGLSRDAPAEAVLSLTDASGATEQRTLKIEQRQYDIQRINGLPPEQVTPNPQLLERIKAEAAEIRAAHAVESNRLDFESPLIWPVTGTITGIYGSQRILNGEPRSPHLGVDIAAPAGTPIKASAGGTVTLSERDLYFTGGTVVIDHGYGLSTVYVHLERIDAHVGDKVAQGQTIGLLGATGRATGPNLHWGVNWYNTALDPQLVAGPMPQ